MEVKPLSSIPFQELIYCFNASFDGYFVNMPTEASYYRQRWSAAKVNYDLSFGMFDNNKLVGFIINAIDTRQNQLIAYNSGTGVIPSFRGKKIVKQIYQKALPILKSYGIQKCTLEVITENIRAINSYESIGFNIVKTYNCFNGKTHSPSSDLITAKQIVSNKFDWNLSKYEAYYSWDNQNESIIRNDSYSYLYINKKSELIGYCIINLNTGYIAQIEVFSGLTEDYAMIINKIGSLLDKIKINNIDNSLIHKKSALIILDFENHINQYEMHLKIN